MTADRHASAADGIGQACTPCCSLQLLRRAGAIWLNHLCCIGLVREAWSGLIAAQPAGFGHLFAGFVLTLFWSYK
ncbi:MAG: hypothetical protein ACOYNF_12230 [Rhodoferax sp.]